jgi:hypothetical protein
MVSPYRAGEPPKAPTCPRCKKALPATDVAQCAKGCGTWVSQFASTEVLTDDDRKPDPVTRWWRVREPCPLCSEKMTLRGQDPGLLQGCDQHGFFIDADTIQHTGLARGVDIAALERKRADSGRVEAEREALAEAAEKERQQKIEIERKEALLHGKVEAMNAEDAAKYDRRINLIKLGAGGLSMTVVTYILDLEDRVARLERRLDDLELRPKS